MPVRLSPPTLAPLHVAVALALPGIGTAQPPSYESLNVCQRVPSAAVAAAVSGRAVDERPVNVKGLTAARCVYGIEIAGRRQAFVTKGYLRAYTSAVGLNPEQVVSAYLQQRFGASAEGLPLVPRLLGDPSVERCSSRSSRFLRSS